MMMNSKKQLANTIQQVNPLEIASHQLSQQHSQILSQQQQQSYQQQQGGNQKNMDQLQQQNQQIQNQQRQGLKNNSLSMSAVVASINLSNSNQINQIQSIQPQSILSPSNISSAANTSQVCSVSQQLGSPQKYQQLNNKAFSLIKNNYFKSNSGMIQNNISIQMQQQISSPSDQLLSPNQQNQHQVFQSQLNNSGSSAIHLVSNKKSPKMSNNSKNKGNSSSDIITIQNQRESIQANKDNDNNNGTKLSEITAINQLSNQKSSNQFSHSIDKTTHLQNIDKIRNTLNNKLSIQTELNHVAVGGNSISNLGLMNYQSSSNMFQHFPVSTTCGSTSTNTIHQQQNLNQPYKKIVSITPQYSNSSKIKFFESQNKQIQDLISSKKDGNFNQNPQIATSSMQEISNSQHTSKQTLNKIDDIEEENQTNKQTPNEYQDENCNQSINNIERNNQIVGNSEVNIGYGNEYSKNSQHQHKQQDLENLNLAATMMIDKLKKREKNPNSAKGHPRNAHQSGLTSNASYSRSSLPSNNSTAVNHYQGNQNNVNNLNSNQSISRNIQAVTGQALHQPAQMISQNSNLQQAPVSSSNTSNQANKNIQSTATANRGNVNTNQQQNSKNQLSKTLSFTLQQYHNLLNHDLNSLQSQQQQQSQQNLMKQSHSQSTNQELCGSVSTAQLNQINLPLVNNVQPLGSQSNTNLLSVKSPTQVNQQQLNATQKHRKVVSMSSSSPKYSKENMYIDCSKGSYNIVDVKKLFKGQSTAQNFHLNSNNQGNSKGSKQLGFGDKGEANFCTPHGNNSQNKSIQHGDNTKALQIKFSKTPGNMSFNNSTNNNNNAANYNENSREVEKTSHKNQDKSKNFLSKITNHQGKNGGLIDESSSKKSLSKKSHKSQSCTAVSSQINLQKYSQNTGVTKDEQKKNGSQVMIQHPLENNIKNKNIYQSQTDFSLLKQQLIEQQQFVGQLTDKQQITNQINQHQSFANQIIEKSQLVKQFNDKQQHISCDDTTAVNSNAKDNRQVQCEQEQRDSHEQILKLENARVENKIDQILKQRIDENSYSQIMDVFAQIMVSDIYFKSSLQKFKICLDSLMHDMNSKMKNLKIFTAKAQQLKKSVEGINNENKQLQDQVSILQNENQQLLSNSTNVTNSNQSKTNNNINMPSDSCNNINVTKINFGNNQSESIQNDENKNVNQFQMEQNTQYSKSLLKQSSEKQTQTALKDIESTEKQKQQLNQNVNQQILKEEIDEATNENTILREYIVEQEKKITAYKDKESSMIKLLLAIKKNGIDIDDIYEKEVINKQKNSNQNNQNNDDDDDQDDENENYSQNHHLRSKFIENIKNGIIDNNRNHSQSLGYADESIINDSDESSFNYYGKTSSLDDSMLSQFNPHPKEISNLNSGRSKIEDGLKWKLRLNLNDLKKMNTQPNDDQAAQQNINNVDINQLKQQQLSQMKLNNDTQLHQQVNNDINNNNTPSNIQNQQQQYGKSKNVQNIFIESEYQECNFDSNKNKRMVSPTEQINLEQDNNMIDQNGQYFDQDNQNIILKDYIFNPKMKISSNKLKDLNEYISQSDYQTHKVDSQMQNNFELEDDQQNEDAQQEESSTFLDNNQIDFQNELMKKLDDISLTWPDDNKPVVF